ncbi:MAG: Adenine DNA glycosylase [Anaerolineales bacterium]|nr:Adenine DNA glycosylase [Anaerolineales bacterium]
MNIASKLLKWYSKNARVMPWRGHTDPYAVWVSEIMLQQTRVETVIPYFKRWMDTFPSVRALAKATEQSVLNAWEGLGYYSRARNLRKAAQMIVDEYSGKLPHAVDELRKLPGIGRYTAGAIASIAFGLDEPLLDANLRRVYTRLFNVNIPADSTEGERLLWNLAAKNLPKGKAGDFNQAMMDLGATICLPKNPRCLICPLMGECEAQKLGVQEQRPVLKPKTDVPHVVHAAAAIRQRGRVLLAKRPSKGLLGGMWEFPNGEVAGDPQKGLVKTLRAGYGLKLRSDGMLTTVQHAYSHFRVTVHAFHCELIETPKKGNLKWVKISELDNLPMGKTDRQIARRLCDE